MFLLYLKYLRSTVEDASHLFQLIAVFFSDITELWHRLDLLDDSRLEFLAACTRRVREMVLLGCYRSQQHLRATITHCEYIM